MTKILIGPDCTPFYVHRSFLTHYSAFFKGVLSEMQNCATPSITLEDVSTSEFELLTHWVYSQSFTGKEFDSTDMARLWDLGGRLGMPRLQNAVMSVLLKIMQNVQGEPRESFIRYFCQEESDTKLKKLTLQALASASLHNLEQLAEHCPRQLLVDVMLKLKGISFYNTPPQTRPNLNNISAFMVPVDGIEGIGALENVGVKQEGGAA